MADRVGRGAIAMAVEPVGDTREVGCGRPAGQDREVAVDRHRIGVDDDAAVPLGQTQGGRGLAARGRACDEDRLPS